jgi:NAD(P)-dependent dehydrogenase (short-subunit alcohol dehydrogenase family)
MTTDPANMSGKTVVVTGASSGIGLATATALSKSGAKVFITARDSARGSAAADAISKESANPVELVLFDLASLASVRKGAEEILERTDRIDVLVNNAGIVLTDRRETTDGLEQTFAVNHLGPFLLTKLLEERLVASAPSRVVNVASSAHKSARKGLHFDDLQSRNAYKAMRVYGRSKLANIYFTTELARRLAGTGVTTNSLHPGTVATGYGRDGDTHGALTLGLKIASPFFLSPEKGALTSVYLASSPDVASTTGRYFVKCKERVPSRAARDPEAAKKLWQVSEELITQAGA